MLGEIMISIIVDNYKRSYLFPLVMKSYCREEFTKTSVEMIIVDDASPSDNHFVEYVRLGLKTIKPFFKVRAFETHKSLTFSAGGTMNIGVKHSQGDLLIFCHSDMFPLNKKILSLTWDRHQETPNMYLASRFVGESLKVVEDWYIPAGASMPRKIYMAVGGQDEQFVGSDSSIDTDFAKRIFNHAKKMGWTFRTDPEITYMHLPVRVGIRSPVKDGRPSKLIHQPWRFRVNPEGWGICDTLEEIAL